MNTKNKFNCIIAVATFAATTFLGAGFWDAVSYAISIAAIADWTYDRFLWRFNFLEKTPRLYGIYEATVDSNYNGGTSYTSKITIKQTLSSISIVEIMESGCCESVTASVARTTPDGPWFLYYTYLTHPKLSTNDDMHYGTTILHIREDGLLVGGYFTNRNQQTAGNLILKRIHK